MRGLLVLLISACFAITVYSQETSPKEEWSLFGKKNIDTYPSSSFMYEFDIFSNFDNYQTRDSYILGLGLNIGYTSRLSKKFGYSLYAFGRTGVGQLGLSARLHHHIHDRFWLGYSFGGGYSTDDYLTRASHITAEVSINSNRHFGLFARSNMIFNNRLEGKDYLVNLGLRTRNKAAVWTSGVVVPVLTFLVLSAIGNSK